MIKLDFTSSEWLAQIHQESVDPPWSEKSFQSLLILPNVHAYANDDCTSFIMLSVIEDEAEILTFATKLQFRRQGKGKKLLNDVIKYLFLKKIEKIFLEVDENNFAAIRLYEQLDFKKYGFRENYYKNSNFETSNALLMRRN